VQAGQRCPGGELRAAGSTVVPQSARSPRGGRRARAAAIASRVTAWSSRSVMEVTQAERVLIVTVSVHLPHPHPSRWSHDREPGRGFDRLPVVTGAPAVRGGRHRSSCSFARATS